MVRGFFKSDGSGLRSKFGRCATCMRIAFWAASAGWGAVYLIAILDWPVVVIWAVLLPTALLSVMTALHILMFALNHSRNTIHAQQGEVVRIGPHAALPVAHEVAHSPQMTRREMIGVAVKFASLAMAACLGLPRRANAGCGDCAAYFGAGYYDCITYFCNTQGQTCCPPGFPYLNHCDCICYDGNGFDCNSYSNCLYCG